MAIVGPAVVNPNNSSPVGETENDSAEHVGPSNTALDFHGSVKERGPH